jgi:hypothetical protein
MSPEEWLASKGKSSSATTTESGGASSGDMSPEQWMASKKSSVASTPAQSSTGNYQLSPEEQMMSVSNPASDRPLPPSSEDPFGFSKARVGSVPMSEYGSNIAKNAAIGAGIGGAIGAVTGPGAIVTGAGGAVAGGLAGLAESVAKDLGLGGGYQTLAGLAGGTPAPVKSTVDFLAKSKLASKVFSAAEDAALMMIPKYGTLRKVASVIPKPEPTIAGREAERALGVEAKTLGVGGNQYRQEATQQIEKEFGQGTTGNALYENAKSAYDKSGNTFLQSDEYQKLLSGLPESTRPAQEARLSQFFKDEAGNPETGDRVVNNLKSYDFFKSLSPKEQTNVRNAFNDYLEKSGSGRIEENARKVAEKEFVAKAKDELPKYFNEGNGKEISKQIFNYSKDALGAQAFKQELANYLVGRKVSDAKVLWGTIADDVNKAIIKDPEEFKRISDVINNAKTEKQLSRAKEMLIKAGFGTYEIKKEKR